MALHYLIRRETNGELVLMMPWSRINPFVKLWRERDCFCCYTFDSKGCSHSEWQLSSYLSQVMSLCDTVLPHAAPCVSTVEPDELRGTTFSQLIMAYCFHCSVTHSCVFTHLFLCLMNTLNFTLHVYVGEIIVWCQTCSRVLECVFCVLARSVVHEAYSQCLGTVSYPRTWESWKWSDKCFWCTATSGSWRGHCHFQRL